MRSTRRHGKRAVTRAEHARTSRERPACSRAHGMRRGKSVLPWPGLCPREGTFWSAGAPRPAPDSPLTSARAPPAGVCSCPGLSSRASFPPAPPSSPSGRCLRVGGGALFPWCRESPRGGQGWVGRWVRGAGGDSPRAQPAGTLTWGPPRCPRRARAQSSARPGSAAGGSLPAVTLRPGGVAC